MRQTPTIKSIQALRAIAVILVVYFHSFTWHANSIQSHFYNLSNWGAIGVDLFFVISGFIMITIIPKYATGTTDQAKDFIVKRIIRILPLYWLISLLIILFEIKNHTLTLPIIIKSIIIFPIIDKWGFIYAVIPQGWTLAYELYFYLIIFIVLLVFKKHISGFVSGILLLLAITGCYIISSSLFINFLLSPLLLEFIFGMAIGAFYHYITIRQVPLKTINLIKTLAITCLLAGIFLMLVTVFIPVNLFKNPINNNFSMLNRVLVWGLPCALFLAGSVLSELLFNIKIPLILIRIGDASFSCYLVHFFLIKKLSFYVLRRLSYNDNADLLMIVYMIAVIVISLYVYKYLEKPLIAKIYKLLNK